MGTKIRQSPSEVGQDLIFSRSFQLRHLFPSVLPDSSTYRSDKVVLSAVPGFGWLFFCNLERGHCFGLVTEFDQPAVKFYTNDIAEREEWLKELQQVKEELTKRNKARKGAVLLSCSHKINKPPTHFDDVRRCHSPHFESAQEQISEGYRFDGEGIWLRWPWYETGGTISATNDQRMLNTK